MKHALLTTACIFCSMIIFGQAIQQQIAAGLQQLEKDKQFAHAVIGLYVADAQTGKLVFEKNSEAGLAPASCQKVVTAASAFELLGKNYRYPTRVFYKGKIVNGELGGRLILEGTGDPSLGSWRYAGTRDDAFFKRIVDSLKWKKIFQVYNGARVLNSASVAGLLPNGWVWEDIGNYYGAAAALTNWHENQYDIILKPGTTAGQPAALVRTEPAETGMRWRNEVLTGAKGSGDNAYIYFGLNETQGAIRGTVPAGVPEFSISGAVPNPGNFLETQLNYFLQKEEISPAAAHGIIDVNEKDSLLLMTYSSPPLDSLVYWFLKKSVNLYGEAFVKTIGLEKARSFDTDKGLALIKDLWRSKGIDASALNIKDGSGLSPANRVTTRALVDILLYAKKQPWYMAFYQALPEMNGIKMKDGYIGGVRSYTGYIKSRSGAEYCFSFIVNNFDGSPGTVREKIWKLLDILK